MPDCVGLAIHSTIVGNQNRKSIASIYDPRLNALNAVRLVLAMSVILWHSFPLTGASVEFQPVRQFLGEVSVDGFFAISGFLIVSSWKRNPEWHRYLLARVIRIFPGFWVCLIITAAVIAPLATMLSTGQGYTQMVSFENITYVLKNVGLRIVQPTIGDTPAGVPFTGAWNGSLWTLWWEFLCYVGVLVLGVLRLYKYRATLPIVFALTLVALIATAYGPIDNYYVVNGARFGIMFAAGMLIEQYAHKISLSWPLIGLASVVALGSMFLPDYRLVGALFLAYVVLGVGVILKSPKLELKNDISYGAYIYAFPLQQLLASTSFVTIGVPLFALAATILTVPLAAGSWFLIERNALKLKPRRRHDRSVQTMAVEGV
jgi:peptidoglycan/LPS O-acetylase OafA/YrhL